MGIAESIQLQQFGHDGNAAGMSLAALAVDRSREPVQF
jgi:hypothetical protein